MISCGTTAVDGTSAAERTATVGVCLGSVGRGSAGADRSVRVPDVRSHSGGTASRSGVRGWRSATGVRSPSPAMSAADSVRRRVRRPAADGRAVAPVRVGEVIGHDGTGP
jgi:hypothetical protein